MGTETTKLYTTLAKIILPTIYQGTLKVSVKFQLLLSYIHNIAEEYVNFMVLESVTLKEIQLQTKMTHY